MSSTIATHRWVDQLGGLLVAVCLAAVLLMAGDTGAQTLAAPPAHPPVGLPATLLPLWDRYGLAFVALPGGDVQIGNARGDGDEDETPAHTVTLAPFWIGKTEVTNGQFAHFVAAGGYDDPGLWTETGWRWRTQHGVTRPECWRNTPSPELPVQCVTWYEALAYTRWLARATGLPIRLPTEAEWEAAARQDAESRFPWGDDDPAHHANLVGAADGFAYAAPVGAYPAGAAPSGALDMIGNVWEWTSTQYRDYPYDAADGREELEGKIDRVVRGGGWMSRPDWATVTARFKDDPDDSDGLQGFRLALTVP